MYKMAGDDVQKSAISNVLYVYVCDGHDAVRWIYKRFMDNRCILWDMMHSTCIHVRCVMDDMKYLSISGNRRGIFHKANTAPFKAMMATHSHNYTIWRERGHKHTGREGKISHTSIQDARVTIIDGNGL